MNSIKQLGQLIKGAPRGGKYYKRVAKPGGGYRYFYTKEEYEGRRGAKPEPQLGFDFGAPEKTPADSDAKIRGLVQTAIGHPITSAEFSKMQAIVDQRNQYWSSMTSSEMEAVYKEAGGKGAAVIKKKTSEETPQKPKEIPTISDKDAQLLKPYVRLQRETMSATDESSKKLLDEMASRGLIKQLPQIPVMQRRGWFQFELTDEGKKAFEMHEYKRQQKQIELHKRMTSTEDPTSPMHPQVRKKNVMAVFKKFKAVGDGRVTKDGKHRVLSMASGSYKLHVLEDMSHKELKSLADAHKIKLPSEKTKKSEESDMSETLQRPDPNSMSKGMYSFYNQENAKPIPDTYLMDLVHAFIEEAFEHESKECNTNEMNLEGQDRYTQVAVAVYNELVQCSQFNPNLRRALERYDGVLNEGYVRNYMDSQGMIHTKNENYTADKMAQVAGYHPTKMALSQYSPNVGPSTLQKAETPMVQLQGDSEDPMQQLHGYHVGLRKALRHEHLENKQSISPLKDTDPHIVDPNKV